MHDDTRPNFSTFQESIHSLFSLTTQAKEKTVHALGYHDHHRKEWREALRRLGVGGKVGEQAEGEESARQELLFRKRWKSVQEEGTVRGLSPNHHHHDGLEESLRRPARERGVYDASTIGTTMLWG